jgi:hypothetical protein
MPFKVCFQDGIYKFLINFASFVAGVDRAQVLGLNYALTVDVAETLSNELQFSSRAGVVFVCTSCPVCSKSN